MQCNFNTLFLHPAENYDEWLNGTKFDPRPLATAGEEESAHANVKAEEKQQQKIKAKHKLGVHFLFTAERGIAKNAGGKTKVQVCGNPLHSWVRVCFTLGAWECPAVTTKKPDWTVCVSVVTIQNEYNMIEELLVQFVQTSVIWLLRILMLTFPNLRGAKELDEL